MRLKKEAMIPVLIPVVLTTLQTISRQRNICAWLSQRVKIIILACLGMTNKDIGDQLNIHFTTVAKWRTRFMEEYENINKLAIAKAIEIENTIIRILSDNSRSGAPAKYSEEVRYAIIQLACRDPKSYGLESSHLSLRQIQFLAKW